MKEKEPDAAIWRSGLVAVAILPIALVANPASSQYDTAHGGPWLACEFPDVCVVTHTGTGLFEYFTGLDGEARSISKALRRADAACLAGGFRYLRVELLGNYQLGWSDSSAAQTAITVSFHHERDLQTLEGRMMRQCRTPTGLGRAGRNNFARWKSEAERFFNTKKREWASNGFIEISVPIQRDENGNILAPVLPGIMAAAFPDRHIDCPAASDANRMACAARSSIAGLYCQHDNDLLLVISEDPSMMRPDEILRCSDLSDSDGAGHK